MSHILHLGSKSFLSAVNPTSRSALSKRNQDNDSEEDNNDDLGTEFEAGDVLGKALALVTQVRRDYLDITPIILKHLHIFIRFVSLLKQMLFL